ncbi:MAG: TadE/TadG family type IV pilus assembly protein [Bryobacteraceae bacterium]|jgi:Flp pilus assembly protein TadG
MRARIQPSARRRKTQAGNAIVEISLCLTALILIMFGIVEYSRLMYAFNFVSYAARSASRYASLHGSSSASPVTQAEMTTYVQALAVALNSSQLVVNTTWSGSASPGNSPGNTVQVVVTYTETPLLTLVMPNALAVTSTSQMVVLQ